MRILIIIALVLASTAARSQTREPAALTSGISVINSPQEIEIQERAIELSGFYILEVARNFSGGQRVGSSYLGNFGLRAAIDLDKAISWKGGSAAVYLLGMHGQNPSEFVGDSQVSSNIDAPANTVRVYEMWLQQAFFEDRFSILGGLYDLNSEFYVTDSSSMFLNSSFGIGKELSQTGLNGPSIFPETSVALRLRGTIGDNWYIQGVVLDAVAGEPGHLHGTHISLRDSDGYLGVLEAGFRNEDTSTKQVQKYGLGFWRYTKDFAHHSELNSAGGPAQVASQGAYALANQPLSDTVSVFARYGWASPQSNQFESNIAAGVVVSGALSARPGDELGVGVTRIDNSSAYREAAGLGAEASETAFELSYKLNFSETIFIQPDLQYILNPGSDPGLKDAWVGALRGRIGF